MNARSQVFEMSVETRQVQEAVLSLFHTILFHRTFPKYNFQNPVEQEGQEESWVLGTLGFEDVDCEHIDHTYVRTQSQELDAVLRSNVADFYSDLRTVSSASGASSRAASASPSSGQVSLEFYQKRRKWPFQEESVPWEVWTVKTEVVPAAAADGERRAWREKVGEMLADKVLYIAEVINRQDYVPVMYTRANLDLIYDTSFSDVQPFLFKVSHACSGDHAGAGGVPGASGGAVGGLSTSPSVGTTVRRLLKDTLAI